jgi:hypothetical protein
MITLLKRVQLAKEFFACPPDKATIFHAGKIAVNCDANSYSINSLSTFQELLAPGEDNIFRFLVDTGGKLWFAYENRPPNKAPKHFQMTGAPFKSASCFTGGNIKFKNKNGVVLKNINHRSGDFYPSFLSLRWVLAILIVNEDLLPFRLPKFIIVKEIKNEKIYKYVWRLKRVKKWVDSFRDDETLMQLLCQKNLNTKTVNYEAVKYSGPYE